MGRGRPRLYKTPEDRAAANRAKSKRSYYKRKAAINTSRRSRYRADQLKTLPFKTAAPDTNPPSSNPVDAPGWLRLVVQTKERLHSLTDGSTRRFLDSLYSKYTIRYRIDTFSDAMTSLEALDKTIKHAQDELLQLTGASKEFRLAEGVGEAVTEALNCVQEIECYASIAKEEAIEAYEKQELMYQQLSY